MPFTIPSLPSGLLFFLEPPCVRRSGLLRPNSRLLAPTHGVSFTVLFPAPCISPCGAPGPPSGLLCVHAVVHLAVSGQEVPEHVLGPLTAPRPRGFSASPSVEGAPVTWSPALPPAGHREMPRWLRYCCRDSKLLSMGAHRSCQKTGIKTFITHHLGPKMTRCRCVICVSFIRRGRVPRAKPPSQRGRGLTWPEGLEGSCEQCGCCCWEC